MSSNSTGAVIVAYEPEIGILTDCIASIANQVHILIVVDNDSSNVEDVESLVDSYPNCMLVQNTSNMGIGSALNRGMGILRDKEVEWVLTLDQDTVMPRKAISCFRQYQTQDDIGIICPAVHYRETNKTMVANEETTEVAACMTSGSYTRVSAWSNVGGFNEEYFIDFVDNEFCKRLTLNGYRLLRVNRLVMEHSLGKTRILPLIGKRVTYHNATRSYYMVRNNLYYIRSYADSISVSKELAKLLYIMAIGLLGSISKKDTLVAYVRAVVDYRNGRVGRLDC